MPSEVILRDVAEEDLPIFFEHQLDPDATEMAAFPSRDREAFMAHLYAHVAKHNVGSRRVLEKCGFRIVGEDKVSNANGEEVEECILKLE